MLHTRTPLNAPIKPKTQNFQKTHSYQTRTFLPCFGGYAPAHVVTHKRMPKRNKGTGTIARVGESKNMHGLLHSGGAQPWTPRILGKLPWTPCIPEVATAAPATAAVCQLSVSRCYRCCCCCFYCCFCLDMPSSLRVELAIGSISRPLSPA